jgi:hypothetical protein
LPVFINEGLKITGRLENKILNGILYKLINCITTLLLIAIYLNLLPYIVSTFDWEYTITEFVLLIAAILLAMITNEFIFRVRQ